MISLGSEQKITNFKPICSARARVGVCAAEMRSETNSQYRKTFVFAFGGVGKSGNSLQVVEKLSVKANVWQGLPNLNVARASASGTTIGDNLYIFGGLGDLSSIERLCLKQGKSDAFETLDVKLPIGCQDMGFVPLPNPNEMLVLGGYNSEKKSLSGALKFSATPVDMDGSQMTY
jgi:hypothetical protein